MIRRVSLVLVAAACVVPAAATADRHATQSERKHMVEALEKLMDSNVSTSCVRGRVSSIDRRWGSLSFTNSRTCQSRGQSGDGLGIYKRSGSTWRYVVSGPCDSGYRLPKVPARVGQELLRGQCH
jgi:hypothetical protein